MEAIDATGHAQTSAQTAPPSLLFLILDTNPYAWNALSPRLDLSTAVAQLLVFINAHLAFSHENRVAVLASQCGTTRWLYPAHAVTGPELAEQEKRRDNGPAVSANKYRPFALIEHSILTALAQLLADTSEADLRSEAPTPVAGALTLALSYINRQGLSLTPSNPSSTSAPADSGGATSTSPSQSASLASRILVVSTSGDLASQYIPLMNAMFAAQHAHVPIDMLKLAGDTVLLQQASFTTEGVFIAPSAASPSTKASGSEAKGKSNEQSKQPINLLPYLFHALLPDYTARRHLVPPTSPHVDFRAACFCHRRVVDVGFVCSICLSIFCSELVDGICLTCGTKLVLGDAEETLVVGEGKKKDKKKKKRKDGDDNGVAIHQGVPVG